MAPSTRSRKKVKATARKPRTTRTQSEKISKKKQLVEESRPLKSSPSSGSHNSPCPKMGALDFESSDDIAPSCCSTPKAQRFRIPEIATCPPAPMKKRMIPNNSLHRRPIAFFAPPDLELFFFFALSDISA